MIRNPDVPVSALAARLADAAEETAFENLLEKLSCLDDDLDAACRSEGLNPDDAATWELLSDDETLRTRVLGRLTP